MEYYVSLCRKGDDLCYRKDTISHDRTHIITQSYCKVYTTQHIGKSTTQQCNTHTEMTDEWRDPVSYNHIYVVSTIK